MKCSDDPHNNHPVATAFSRLAPAGNIQPTRAKKWSTKSFCLFMLAIFCCGTPLVAQWTTTSIAKPVVTIVNNTGFTIYNVQLSQTATSNWEEDVLKEKVLRNGNRIRVTLAYPLTVANRYDIKLTDEDGDTYTKWNVFITDEKIIIFTLDDLD